MKKIIILILFLFFGQLYFPQEYSIKKDLKSNSQNSVVYGVLNDIEKGILRTNISDISPYLASQVYLSFFNGISGFYSSNQAYYTLEKFLKEYKAISFSFSKIKISTTNPFAIGSYYFEHKGNRSEARVYLTLKLTGKSWQITQISIN